MASDLFKKSLYLFRGAPLSRWPVDSFLYSMIFGRRCSFILETSCSAKLYFEDHGLDVGGLSHFKDDVGDEITPMDVFGWYGADGNAR